MDTINPASNLRPGIKAVVLAEHILYGTEYTDTLLEFTCIITEFQIVEIDSDPGWMSDETNKLVQVIAIKAPDTDGVIQRIGIDVDLLLVAANDN